MKGGSSKNVFPLASMYAPLIITTALRACTGHLIVSMLSIATSKRHRVPNSARRSICPGLVGLEVSGPGASRARSRLTSN